MASVLVCDGCGRAATNEARFLPVGMLDRFYCESCEPVARKYMTDMKEARESAALLFSAEIGILRSNCSLKARPDEP